MGDRSTEDDVSGDRPAGRAGDRAALLAAGLVVVVGAAALGLVAIQRGDEVSASPGNPPVTTSAPAAQGGWERRDSLRTARDDFGTIILDDRIWITGGMTGDRGNKLATTEIYDPSTDSWEMGVPMLTARSSLAAAEVDGIFYAIGGSTLENPYLAVVEAYDPDAGEWTQLAPLATPRYEHAAVALDGLIYVIGGQTDAGPTADVEIFDPATGSWSAGPSLAIARGSTRAVVWDDQIWVGGGNTLDGPTDTWEVLDPAAGEWQAAPPMPEPMYNFGLAVYDDELHAIYHDDHFVLGPGGDEWRVEDPPPISRHGMGMIQLGDVMYAIGGCTEDPLADVNTVQVYAG